MNKHLSTEEVQSDIEFLKSLAKRIRHAGIMEDIDAANRLEQITERFLK